MSQSPFMLYAGLTVLLVGFGMTTDLMWRRIPNVLTFSAFGIALAARVAFQGWAGLGLALAGAFLAPVLLIVLHGGVRMGMGDLKLAAAVGAAVGPLLAIAAMLVTAIAGGWMAVTWMIKKGGTLVRVTGMLKRIVARGDAPQDAEPETMPYGVAIAVGSILTLAVCWWTGNQNWVL